MQPDFHALAPGPRVCSSIVDSLDSKWCQANCVATPGTKLCGAACKCSTVAHTPKTDARNDTADKKEPGCKSHTDTVSDAWCDLTCAATPDTDDCVASCRCPGWGKNPATVRQRDKKKESGPTSHCVPLADTASGDWCDGSCLNTPNADQCWDACDCPGRKKNRNLAGPSPTPVKAVCKSLIDSVADEWCDQTCIEHPNEKSCTATCHCPGWREALKEAPENTENVAVCKSRTPQIPAAWCDSNCRKTPDVEECKAACKCPAFAASPSPKPGVRRTACKSIVDTATGAWCDENCKNDPNAEWCDPSCRCPGWNATLAAQHIAQRGHNCTGVIDTASGNWCDENCEKNPDTPQCTKLCICSSSKMRRQPSPSPTPAICKGLTSTASSEWCDQNCLAKPATDSCKATCKCPPAAKSTSGANVSDSKPQEYSWLHLLQYEQIRLM